MSGKWIVFLGAPGCGKGTQAEYLVSDFGFSVVSVGDVLRANLDKELSDGRKIGEIIGSGSLLPDEVVIDLVRDQMKKVSDVSSKNFLFDGFPRTEGQARALNSLAAEFSKSLFKVINFVVGDDVITKRILGRVKCSKCGKIYNKFFLMPKKEGVCDVCGGTEFEQRADDNEASLIKRLSEYHSKTKPLIDFYAESGILYDIDAGRSFDEVKESLLKGLDLKFLGKGE